MTFRANPYSKPVACSPENGAPCVRHLLLAIIYGAIGSIVILVGGYTYILDARPDLKVWHRTVLDAESPPAMTMSLILRTTCSLKIACLTS